MSFPSYILIVWTLFWLYFYVALKKKNVNFVKLSLQWLKVFIPTMTWRITHKVYICYTFVYSVEPSSSYLDLLYQLSVYFSCFSLFYKLQCSCCQISTTGCVQLDCMPVFAYRKLRCLWILPAVSPETKCDDYPPSDELTLAHGGIHHPFNPPTPFHNNEYKIVNVFP